MYGSWVEGRLIYMLSYIYIYIYTSLRESWLARDEEEAPAVVVSCFPARSDHDAADGDPAGLKQDILRMPSAISGMGAAPEFQTCVQLEEDEDEEEEEE